MKKLLCMIMALTMVLGLAACGGSGEPADNGEAVDYKIGIITGTTGTTLSPKSTTTRAQVAVMLHRYLTD